jgi:hypothetical protein
MRTSLNPYNPPLRALQLFTHSLTCSHTLRRLHCLSLSVCTQGASTYEGTEDGYDEESLQHNARLTGAEEIEQQQEDEQEEEEEDKKEEVRVLCWVCWGFCLGIGRLFLMDCLWGVDVGGNRRRRVL